MRSFRFAVAFTATDATLYSTAYFVHALIGRDMSLSEAISSFGLALGWRLFFFQIAFQIVGLSILFGIKPHAGLVPLLICVLSSFFLSAVLYYGTTPRIFLLFVPTTSQGRHLGEGCVLIFSTVAAWWPLRGLRPKPSIAAPTPPAV